MANQQRSVIVTAIILAVILGGALVWLLNRTPANQLTAQAPANDESSQNSDLVPVDGSQLAQIPAAQGQTGATGLSPTEPGLTQSATTGNGSVQGVTATAATGPEQLPLLASFGAVLLGSGGLFASLKRFGR